MAFLKHLTHLLEISNSHGILRRYFVVNGFDGALTMLGLLLGFALTQEAEISAALNVCMAAAIALAVSGVSSAYVSESSERHRELMKLQGSMLSDLSESHHAQASKWVPWLVAMVNGLSPLCLSLLILMPIFLASHQVFLPYSPYILSICIAIFLLFLLGVFLGNIAGHSWLRSGFRTLVIGLITMALIYLFTGV